LVKQSRSLRVVLAITWDLYNCTSLFLGAMNKLKLRALEGDPINSKSPSKVRERDESLEGAKVKNVFLDDGTLVIYKKLTEKKVSNQTRYDLGTTLHNGRLTRNCFYPTDC